MGASFGHALRWGVSFGQLSLQWSLNVTSRSEMVSVPGMGNTISTRWLIQITSYVLKPGGILSLAMDGHRTRAHQIFWSQSHAFATQ